MSCVSSPSSKEKWIRECCMNECECWGVGMWMRMRMLGCRENQNLKMFKRLYRLPPLASQAGFIVVSIQLPWILKLRALDETLRSSLVYGKMERSLYANEKSVKNSRYHILNITKEIKKKLKKTEIYRQESWYKAKQQTEGTRRFSKSLWKAYVTF